MAKDQFKNFVEENRVDFESYHQDFQEMWMEIQKGIEPPIRPMWQRWIKVAAAFVIVAFSSMGVIIHQQQGRLPLELREAEDHYYTIITAKMEIVDEHHDEVDELIWEDLELLDQAYTELKSDFKEKVDNEEVVQAMIENYRAKLEILDQILDEIEDKDDETVWGMGI
jgi:hypothetical protein